MMAWPVAQGVSHPFRRALLLVYGRAVVRIGKPFIPWKDLRLASDPAVLKEDNLIDEGHRQPAAALRAVRLASLARASVVRLPVPARPRRDAGRRRHRQRMLPGRRAHDSRRPRELAPRVVAVAERQLAARRTRRRRGPHPHRDELLAARGRLLPPGRVLPRRRTIRAGCRPSRRWRRASKKFISLPQSARRGGRDPVRERRAALRLFRARAVPADEAAGAHLHGRPRLDQGRDVVHAGARRPAARHLGADDRRPGPGRHAAPPQDRRTAPDYEVPIGRCIDYLEER